MPLSPSTLLRLSARFAKRKLYDVSDSLAIAAACARRYDIFGKEVWIDTAIEKLTKHNLPIPSIFYKSCFSDLGV